MIKTSPVLQYQIELEIAGMIDRPEVALPTTTKLQQLLQYQDRWRTEGIFYAKVTTKRDSDSPVYYLGDLIVLPVAEEQSGAEPCYKTIKIGHVQPSFISGTGGGTHPSIQWQEYELQSPVSNFDIDPIQNTLLGWLQISTGIISDHLEYVAWEP